MAIEHLILANEYRDSVSLMQVAADLRDIDGVDDAAVVMMTAANLALLDDVGMSIGTVDPRPSDLLMVIAADDAGVARQALDRARKTMDEQDAGEPDTEEAHEPSRSIVMAKSRLPDASLVVISTPGEFAVQEAEKAIRSGCHAMLFSDGISIADEARLKQLATEHDLLVMGPDCGTAMIAGVPLAFANEVGPGPIGIVGASGTGIQAIVCAVDSLGAGISHAIGTGGHDLHEDVGGLSMDKGIRLLADDPQTNVIVLVSKPPADRIAQRVLDTAAQTGKPVVVCFLGSEPQEAPEGITITDTLDATAAAAVELVTGSAPQPSEGRPQADPPQTPSASQRFVRGLYSGGTLCFEATMILGRHFDAVSGQAAVASNTPIAPAVAVDDPWHSTGHTLIDLGDDVFTRGRPHPMIDHTIRNARLIQEAEDPDTAVIIVDVVLGHGSHPDPAQAMAPAVTKARTIAQQAGRELPIIALVVGTSSDPQGLNQQIEALRDLGMQVHRNHQQALSAVTALIDATKGTPA